MNDEIHPADTVDNKETTVVATEREPLEQFCIR